MVFSGYFPTIMQKIGGLFSSKMHENNGLSQEKITISLISRMLKLFFTTILSKLHMQLIKRADCYIVTL